MKKLGSIFFGLSLLISTGAYAEGPVQISKRTVELPVDISKTKLRLSLAGYDTPTVKVLIPELADVTILDHRNPGESAPCLATIGTYEPNDVIQNNPSIERVSFDITLDRHAYPDLEKKVCYVELTESVVGKIRGYTFAHVRSHPVAKRHLDDCR